MASFTAPVIADIIVNNICPVCRLQNTILRRGAGPDFELHCARCGDYDITYGPVIEFQDIGDEDTRRRIIAEWIWYQNSQGIIPKITKDNFQGLLGRPLLPFFERAKRLLVYLAEKTKKLGTSVPLTEVHIQAMMQTFEAEDVTQIAKFLQDESWVHIPPNGKIAMVQGRGFVKAEEWKQIGSSSSQVFVAMWFDPNMDRAWTHGISPGIKRAGYKPSRIDAKQHINKICDEIIAEIKRSRFIVADYTDHRGGVYYEAGYAAGRGLPVIPTCRKDQMSGLHFDIRQYNCIDWESPEELADRLQARIEALFGDGPLKPT